MDNVIIIGGGLAGCTAALELAKAGCFVYLVEKSDNIGGKTRNYGCKSDGKCTDCGVCLTRGVFENTENSENITIYTNATPADCIGNKGDFALTIRRRNELLTLKAAYILLATGFDEPDRSFITIDGTDVSRIHTGTEMELLFKNGTSAGVFEEPLKSAAFIQCYGSRTIADKAPYCSKICCGYSTRMARALKHLYPESVIDIYYMDMQEVETCDYPKKLKECGINMNRCRVSHINSGEQCRVWFERDGTQTSREYDRVILCGGIRPNCDNAALADIFSLDLDENGFLQPEDFSVGSGVIPIGCASAPENISRTISLAKHAAFIVLAEQREEK